MGFLRGIADWCRRAIPLVGDWIGSLVDGLQDAIEPFVWARYHNIRDYIDTDVKPLAVRAEGVARTVKETFKTFKDWAKGAIEWLLKIPADFIRDPYDYLHKWFGRYLTEHKETAWSVISPFLHSVIKGFGNIIAFATDPWGYIGRWAGDWFHKFREHAWSVLKPFLEWAIKGFQNIYNFCTDPWGYLGQWVGEWFTKFREHAWSVLKPFFEAVIKGFENIYSFCRDPWKYLRDWISWLITVDKNFINELVEVLKEPLRIIFDYFTSLFLADLSDYHIDMETLEIVEPEPPVYLKVLAEKREFK